MIEPAPRYHEWGPLDLAGIIVMGVSYLGMLYIDTVSRIWGRSAPFSWLVPAALPVIVSVSVFYLLVIRADDAETLEVLLPGDLEAGLSPETRFTVSIRVICIAIALNLILVAVLLPVLQSVTGWDSGILRILVFLISFLSWLYFSHRIHLLYNPSVRELMGP